MPDTGYSRSPKLAKGALVQVTEDLVAVVPHVIPFQYNPETVSRTLTPYNPFDGDAATRGQVAPTVQPFDPKESITLTLELDASDQLEEGDPVAVAFGVSDRIAAIERLTLPTKGLFGDLAAAAVDLVSGPSAAKKPERPSVPVVLFVWGPGRILPVRVTSYSIEEQLFSPTLHPVQAKVSLGLEVLTPDVFKCQKGPAVELAVAAYKLHRLQQSGLAVAHMARNLDIVRGLLPL
jgi:hypothetical protein